MVSRGLPLFPSLRSLNLAETPQVSLKESGELSFGPRGVFASFPGRGKGSHPVGRPRRPRGPLRAGPRAARPRRRRARLSMRAASPPPPAPPAPPQRRAALTEAAPAQRAVAAVQDRAQLAQQRRREVEQERVRRERTAGPAARRRRRPGHGSAAGDQGPVRGGMRSPGLSAPARCYYTTAEILLPRRPRLQNLPSPTRGRAPHDARRCPAEMPLGTPGLAAGSPLRLRGPPHWLLRSEQAFRPSGFGT